MQLALLLQEGFLELWLAGGFSQVVAWWGLLFSCSVWAAHCSGFSCCRTQALELIGSVVVAHGLSNPIACGI